MREISFDEPHRKKHFEFFLEFEQPQFSICGSLDVTDFKSWQKAHNRRFNHSLVYFITRSALSIPEFRRRIRGRTVVEHDCIDPSFTVPTEVSEVFSFCTVPFALDYTTFLERAQSTQQEMTTDPSFEDVPGRDDYFFMSAIPWISFTSVSFAMGTPKTDSVPRFAWGKVTQNGGRLSMPLCVQAHHAVVDGVHMGRLFQNLEIALSNPEQFVSEQK